MMPNICQSEVEGSDFDLGNVARKAGSKVGGCWMPMTGCGFTQTPLGGLAEQGEGAALSAP